MMMEKEMRQFMHGLLQTFFAAAAAAAAAAGVEENRG